MTDDKNCEKKKMKGRKKALPPQEAIATWRKIIISPTLLLVN